MHKKLVNRYVALPMAINVFRQDQDYFSKFKMGNIYSDWLDAAIEKASQDFYELKSGMISMHHLNVKRIGQTTYNVNHEIIEYSAEELKEITADLMDEYLNVDFERKKRGWR